MKRLGVAACGISLMLVTACGGEDPPPGVDGGSKSPSSAPSVIQLDRNGVADIDFRLPRSEVEPQLRAMFGEPTEVVETSCSNWTFEFLQWNGLTFEFNADQDGDNIAYFKSWSVDDIGAPYGPADKTFEVIAGSVSPGETWAQLEAEGVKVTREQTDYPEAGTIESTAEVDDVFLRSEGGDRPKFASANVDLPGFETANCS